MTQSRDTITLTRADLAAIAAKIAGHENSGLSKPAVLNMIAASILGPRHDWGAIKHSAGQILSQRAGGSRIAPETTPDLAVCTPVMLADEHNPDDVPVAAHLSAATGGGLLVDCDDGHTVWIERNDAQIKVHLYSPISDGPASISILPGHLPRMTSEAFDDEVHMRAPSTPLTSEAMDVLGYQVFCPDTGEHWNDRPSFEILDMATGLDDFTQARKDDRFFVLMAITDGMIEEPTFA